MTKSRKTHTNRLGGQTSPYLLKHAHNPVDWFPWSDEPFEIAKKEDKPVFLSIGYSTCHWCHVMEKESFSNERIAKIMNDNFVSIKVDREEHPHIDIIYMNAVQTMTGSGGWPLSVFLTPEGKPFYGGTYFPPRPIPGHFSFEQVLLAAARMWKEKRAGLINTADKIKKTLEELCKEAEPETLSPRVLKNTLLYFERNFDREYGGFGRAPKFPQPTALTLLLIYWHKSGERNVLKMVETTLDAMSAGGIYDHLGGGFHRYSTDRKWIVPHFEKMLYDQALLSSVYIQAYQVTRKNDHAVIPTEVYDYVLRDMTGTGGGFYSAEDADSEGGEGTFYLWNPKETDPILGPENATILNEYYGITGPGNFEDGRSILHIAAAIQELAHKFGKDPGKIAAVLADSRALLLKHRATRPRPHRDDKIIAGWNGLMISSLAYGGSALKERKYVDAAMKCADFLLNNLMCGDRLMRYHRNGKAVAEAVLEDYAFAAMGLFDLYQATFETKWLNKARHLAEQMIQLFSDRAGGAFFQTAGDNANVMLRIKDTIDGPMPSGNSVAALVLLKLGRLLKQKKFIKYGENIINAASGQLTTAPGLSASMSAAADFLIGPPQEIVISGDAASEDTKTMLELVGKYFLPHSTAVFHPTGRNGENIEKLCPFLKEYKPLNNKATAFVCKNYTCQNPISDVKLFDACLDKLAQQPR